MSAPVCSNEQLCDEDAEAPSCSGVVVRRSRRQIRYGEWRSGFRVCGRVRLLNMKKTTANAWTVWSKQ
jgi:hypothetical protein